jgi:hypothetical protein
MQKLCPGCKGKGWVRDWVGYAFLFPIVPLVLLTEADKDPKKAVCCCRKVYPHCKGKGEIKCQEIQKI